MIICPFGEISGYQFTRFNLEKATGIPLLSKESCQTPFAMPPLNIDELEALTRWVDDLTEPKKTPRKIGAKADKTLNSKPKLALS